MGIIMEVVGLAKYLRFGLEGTGFRGVTANHVGHLAGAVTCLAAYGLTSAMDSRHRTATAEATDTVEMERKEG